MTSGHVFSPSFEKRALSAPTRIAEPITLEDAERSHIRKTLTQTRGVISGPNGAAVRLGIKRSTLYFRMRKLGISRSIESACSVAG